MKLLHKIAFVLRYSFIPSGCSLNHVAAHYTPNKGDNTKLSTKDIMKVVGVFVG